MDAIMGLFDSILDLTKDVVTIVAAPVEAVVDIVSVPVKEIAEVTETLVKDIKSLKD